MRFDDFWAANKDDLEKMSVKMACMKAWVNGVLHVTDGNTQVVSDPPKEFTSQPIIFEEDAIDTIKKMDVK